MRVLGDISRLGAKRQPEKTAIIIDDSEVSYRDLNRQVNQLANGLLAAGIRAGDHIGVFGRNSIEWVICSMAITKIGGVVVGVNFRYQVDELVYVINDSNTSWMLYDPQFADMVRLAIPGFTRDVRLLQMDGDSDLTIQRVMNGQPDSEPEVSVDPNSAAALTYTSGTTGNPKGVLMSHRSILSIYLGMILEGDMARGEKTLVPLPLFHSAGMNGMVGTTLYMGGTVVLFGTGFDPDEILSLVERHKISLTMWVPTQLAMLINHPGVNTYNVSSLSRIWYGSSPISGPVLEKSQCIFSARFYQFFGQTETGMITILRPDDHADRAEMTGQEMVNSEMRLIDEDGEDVSVGEVGEIIYAQKAHGMMGYYNKPEANAETIKDGWIYTGDLARLEEEGFITLVDRVKDMIISGAENIYPKEVETAIDKYVGVKDVAVFGIPDDIYGESVCAAVILEKGVVATERDIINHCVDLISSYKKPKKVIFMETFPRNAMGKVTKNVLREPFWSEQAKRI